MAGKRFEVELPEEVQGFYGWQDEEVSERTREVWVMDLLRRHVISQGKAAELLDISRWDLVDVMARHMIPAIDLTPDEVRREAQPIKSV